MPDYYLIPADITEPIVQINLSSDPDDKRTAMSQLINPHRPTPDPSRVQPLTTQIPNTLLWVSVCPDRPTYPRNLNAGAFLGNGWTGDDSPCNDCILEVSQ